MRRGGGRRGGWGLGLRRGGEGGLFVNGGRSKGMIGVVHGNVGFYCFSVAYHDIVIALAIFVEKRFTTIYDTNCIKHSS